MNVLHWPYLVQPDTWGYSHIGGCCSSSLKLLYLLQPISLHQLLLQFLTLNGKAKLMLRHKGFLNKWRNSMNKMKFNGLMAITLTLVLGSSSAIAGVVDPDCDAGDAAKSTAMKATVGAGGRCTPAEAAKDMTKEAVGIEDKGPLSRNKKDEGLAKKATKKALD